MLTDQTVPRVLQCSATNVEKNLWAMSYTAIKVEHEIDPKRKACCTVCQMRDLPLNITWKDDFFMILLFRL